MRESVLDSSVIVVGMVVGLSHEMMVVKSRILAYLSPVF